LAEATWGADPLERYGGFSNLTFDPNAHFNSALAPNGHVSWSTVQAQARSSSEGEGGATVSLRVRFREINWAWLQLVYGWSALQYHAWARGTLTVRGLERQTVELFTDGLLELRVDGVQYFGGDYYRYRRAPIVLNLLPGPHTVELRLVRDVRALGGVGEARVDVILEAKSCQGRLNVDVNSLVISETAQGKLGCDLASVNVRNDMNHWARILRIRSLNVRPYAWRSSCLIRI
jgi:hypothetical protein